MPRNDLGTWKIVFCGLLIFFFFVMLGYSFHLFQWLCTVCVCTALSAIVTETLLLRKRISLYTLLFSFFKHIQTIFNSFRVYSNDSHEQIKLTKKYSEKGSQYLSEAHVDIDTCLHFILRDFVLSWYHSLSSNNDFSKDVYYVLEDLSAALYSRVRKVNKYKFAKNFTSIYHVYFKQYTKCLEETRVVLGKSSLIECIDNTSDIEMHFKNYHSALASTETEIAYLKHVTNIILEVLTPVDVLTCSVARKFIVDVIANNVFLPLMDHITDPNWVNKILIILLSDDGAKEKLSKSSIYKAEEKSLFQTLTKDQDLTMQTDNKTYCNTTEAKSHLTVIPSVITNDSLDTVSSVEKFTSERMYETNTAMDLSIDECDSVSILSENTDEQSEFYEQQMNANHSKKPIKSSKSFEHLSSFVLNRLVELEKPIEYITENLAHYFRIANEESEQTDSSAISNAKSISSNRIDSTDSLTANLSPSLNLRRRSTSILEQSHSICHALEDAIAASAGPVLANKLDDIKSQGLPVKGSLDKSLQVSQSTEQFHESSLSSTIQPLPGDLNYLSSPLKEDHLQLNLSISSESTIDSTIDDQQSSYTMDQNESVMEAVEMSPDNRCFMNLFIPSAEIAEEPGGIGHYVLYCIQYEAWYLDTSPVQVPNSDILVDISEPRMVLQGSQVKRRFREFLVLHSRLEENNQTRPFLQNIQKPNRWMTLPFNKIDHDITEERRIFLERYLQKLISIEEITASNELREFLAYGSDASIAFVKKVPDSMVPRIDKFLAKKVSGMWEKFRVVLPTSGENTTLVAPITSIERKSFLGFQFGAHEGNYPINVNFGHPEYEPDVHQLEEYMKRFINDNKNIDWIDGSQKEGNDENFIFSETPTPLSQDKSITSFLLLCDKNAGNTSSEENELFFFDDNNLTKCMVCLDRDIPLASAVINLGVDGIYNENRLIKKNRFIYCLKRFAGEHIESWLNNKIDERTTMEMNIKYLRQIRDSIWPGGVLPMEPDPEVTEEEKIVTKKTSLQKLKGFFPNFLPLLLGAKEYDNFARVFQSSLQHPKLVRHFMYNALDLLLITIVPEAKTESFCHRFMSNIP